MKYFKCSCDHTTADHAGHGHAECLIDLCHCAAMIPQEEVVLEKGKRVNSHVTALGAKAISAF